MSIKVLISQINEVTILHMKEAMHVIGYSTLPFELDIIYIYIYIYIYIVKLLNVWGGKNRIGTKKKKFSLRKCKGKRYVFLR